MKETIGGTLEFAKFETTIKCSKDISIEQKGSKDLMVR